MSLLSRLRRQDRRNGGTSFAKAGASCARTQARVQQRGLTLVEILIVVVLIALLSGAIIFGSGMLSGSRQRAAATLIISGVRMGLARANTTGRPARMVFDLDKERLLLEETSSLVMARSFDDEENSGAGAEPADELEQAVTDDANRIVEGPRAPKPKFTPIKEFSEEEGGRPLGEGIKFRMVQTEHDGEPRLEGRAYLYFWPGGQTERAVVQIARGDDDEGVTVMISALTGRARIERGRVELPQPRFDDEFSERREE